MMSAMLRLSMPQSLATFFSQRLCTLILHTKKIEKTKTNYVNRKRNWLDQEE